MFRGLMAWMLLIGWVFCPTVRAGTPEGSAPAGEKLSDVLESPDPAAARAHHTPVPLADLEEHPFTPVPANAPVSPAGSSAVAWSDAPATRHVPLPVTPPSRPAPELPVSGDPFGAPEPAGPSEPPLPPPVDRSSGSDLNTGRIDPLEDLLAQDTRIRESFGRDDPVRSSRQPEETTHPEPPTDLPYQPWQQRRGPAYPGEFWPSFGRDAKELPATLWDDTKATATNRMSWVLFGLAAGGGIALREDRGDNQVAEHFAKEGNPLGGWDAVGDVGGNPGLHFAAAGALYFTSLAREDTKNYEISKTMLNALAINGMLTVGLKVAANTDAPNGDSFAFPSGHTSSSFCMATVMYKEYGPWVGLPAYAFAGFVGYERCAARNHDLSDVVAGALIGMAVGHAVAENHEWKVFDMDVVPYADSRRGGVGLGLAKRW